MRKLRCIINTAGIIESAHPTGNTSNAIRKKYVESYDRLAWNFKQMWSMKNIVVTETLETVSKNLKEYTEEIGITNV